MIAEPVTLLTDYLLAGWTAWLGWRVARERRTLWSAALLAMAAAALLGGTWHGFQQRMPDLAQVILWKATMACIGMVSLFLLSASARDFLPRIWANRVVVLAGIEFLLFLVWIMGHDTFIVAVIDYLPSLVLCGAMAFFARHRHHGAPWIIAAILLILLGTSLQQLGISIHNNFNHNDLYHCIQIVANTLLARGARGRVSTLDNA